MSKLKDVTEKQITSVEKSNNAITAIESVSVLKSFLVGTRLGELKYQMVQMKDEGYILNSLVLDTKNITINDQINILELQQIKVGNFISKQEDKFSLFGWLVRSL